MGVEGKVMSTTKTFISILVLGLVGLLFLIIFGNLTGNLGFTNDVATITNESIAMGLISGLGTINDNTNADFVSWNASLVLNRTGGVGGGANQTLVEGTDYIIFPTNGSIGNLTDEWNNSFVTYTSNRLSQGEQDSNAVTLNLTGGAVTFFGFANVWFVLLAITLLIIIVISVIKVVGGTGKSGFSS